MKIKLGVIGYGGMGKWHAQNAPRAGVEIAAVCDIDEVKQKEAVDAGYKMYPNADELLADPEVNTVILTVPNYLHKEMCIKAAEAGKNVITEKPAAMNVQELDEMEAACKKAGVFFTSHQNRRWDKDMLTVKKAYDDGLLGNIFTIESKLHSGNGYMHEWHLYKKYGGGMIYDWGVHLIDQILFMMPGVRIKSVYADIKNVLHEEVDDYFKIIMKMENGITAHIELSTYILKYQPRWLAAGDKGTMVVKTFASDRAIYRTPKILEELPPQPVFQQPEQAALYQTVMALPEIYRIVLVLFYYEELSVQEIGKVLDLESSAVTTRLSRARAKLKEQLGEVWQNE